jgi:putative salt-induced outer membrane protein YdiY
MKKQLLVAMFLVATQAVFADQITLNNGDRITGSIVKGDAKELVVKTPSAGDVTIARASITAIAADGPVYIGLSDGQTVAGKLQTNGAQLQVVTQAAGTVTTTLASVTTFRNQAEQTAYETQVERFRNPRLVDLWTGFLDFGLAGTAGNAKTQTFSLSTRAERATNRDKIAVYYTSIFSSNSTAGAKATTANSKRGGVTYDVNLNKQWFAWGSVELEADQFQQLDLRFVPQGGAGHHTINTDATKLDLRVGVSGNREFFATGLKRNSAEIVLGEDFIHNFSKTSSIQQKIRFYPNVSNSGNYRMNFDTTYATAVKKWFSLQFTVSDRYLSNPVPGRKTNDVLYSAGVRLTFAQ